MEDGPQRNLRILYVDDSIAARRTFALLMDTLGKHQVTICGNPIEASERLKGSRFDIVLSDVDFMDGFVDDTDARERIETVERFFKAVLDAKIALVLFSGAAWDIPVTLPPGVECVSRLTHWEDLEQILFKTVQANETSKESIDPKELHRLARPDWHVATPIMKWELRQLEKIAEGEDPAALCRGVELRGLKLLFREAKHAHWSGRELNELIDRYNDLVSSKRRKPHKPTSSKASHLPYLGTKGGLVKR